MGQAVLRTSMSEQEYLAFERASPEKHEYVNGEIFAMSGGTVEHANIAANLIRELGNALAGRGCRVLTSDMRVKIPSTDHYLYPDGSVVCGRGEYADDKRDTLLNPRVIIEVLSSSSEAYDRGDKFDAYRSILSFQEYVIASQTEARIELFARQPDGTWKLSVLRGGDKLTLNSVGATIEVDRVYADVFEQP